MAKKQEAAATQPGITSELGGGERLHGQARGHDKNGDGFADKNYPGRGNEMVNQDQMRIGGINQDNPTNVNQVSAQTTLADGTKLFTEVRQGSITIEGGELRLETDSNDGRLRLTDVYDADQQIRLGDLDELSFDYEIVSSSRTDVLPVIRLLVDADGNLATTADRGELVFEYSYQNGAPLAAGAEGTVDLTQWVVWQRSFGQNRDQIVNMTGYSDWSDADGFTPAGGLTFNANSLVLGWSVALGSGNGTAVIKLDDLTIGGTTYDFV